MSAHLRSSMALVILASILTAACTRETQKTASSADSASTAAATVDSALPRDVEIARFRSGLDSVSELTGGLPSRDALVDAFIKRLAARDSTKLGELGLTKAEFAWIYYPESPLGKPPYDLSPGLMYFQFDGNNRKGFVHLLEERGGKDLKVVGMNCAPPEMQGVNRVYAQCLFKRLQAPGDTLTELLFGGIIERHGKFKLLNFANKF